MKDEKFFTDLIKNSISWALCAVFFLILVLLVAAPLVLALAVDWMWIFAYAAYLVILIWLIINEKKKEANR